MIGYNKRETCAGCGGRQFESILNLGVVPLAGYFPNKDELSNQSKYPLNLVVCKYCKLVQTDSVIDPALLFEDYRYLSSVGLSGHFENVANIINENYDVKDKKILEIGCNDGVLLEPLKKVLTIIFKKNGIWLSLALRKPTPWKITLNQGTLRRLLSI